MVMEMQSKQWVLLGGRIDSSNQEGLPDFGLGQFTEK